MICPICKKEFSDSPAISRRDNNVYICPDCGTREALEDVPDSCISPKTKQEILEAVFNYRKEHTKIVSIEVLLEKAAKAIEEKLAGTVSTITNIEDGLYEITISDKQYDLTHTIYINAFYEVYIKTHNLEKAISDIVSMVEQNMLTARGFMDEEENKH